MLVVSGQLLRQQTGPELDRILINDLFAATGIVSQPVCASRRRQPHLWAARQAK
jgi:hypothetical protein